MNGIYYMHVFSVTSVAAESAPGDEVYVKAVHLATTVYRLEGDNKESVQFVSIQENSTKMMTIGLLQKEHVIMMF